MTPTAAQRAALYRVQHPDPHRISSRPLAGFDAAVDVADVPAGQDPQTYAGGLLSWVTSKWNEFAALDPKIEDLQHRWASVAYAASSSGDDATAAVAQDSITRLGELRQLEEKALELADYLRGAVPSLQGLGAVPLIPLVAIGAVVALAGIVAYVMTREPYEEKLLDGVLAGKITPGQVPELVQQAQAAADAAAKRPNLVTEFTDALKWIVLGVIGFMALKTLREFT